MDLENLLRTDGRFPNEFRNTQIGVEMVDKMPRIVLKAGCTEVEISQDAPSGRSDLSFNLTFLEMARADPISDRGLYEIKSKLAEIFTNIVTATYPVAVGIVVRYDDGGLLSVIVNAITIFFCYTGIPIKDLCFSVCRGDSRDLSLAEINRGFSLVLAYSYAFKEVVYLESFGACTPDGMIQMIQKGIEDCEFIKEIAYDFLYKTVNSRSLPK